MISDDLVARQIYPELAYHRRDITFFYADKKVGSETFPSLPESEASYVVLLMEGGLRREIYNGTVDRESVLAFFSRHVPRKQPAELREEMVHDILYENASDSKPALVLVYRSNPPYSPAANEFFWLAQDPAAAGLLLVQTEADSVAGAELLGRLGLNSANVTFPLAFVLESHQPFPHVFRCEEKINRKSLRSCVERHKSGKIVRMTISEPAPIVIADMAVRKVVTTTFPQEISNANTSVLLSITPPLESCCWRFAAAFRLLASRIVRNADGEKGLRFAEIDPTRNEVPDVGEGDNFPQVRLYLKESVSACARVIPYTGKLEQGAILEFLTAHGLLPGSRPPKEDL